MKKRQLLKEMVSNRSVRQIFFNEVKHTYTDDLGNLYTSMTTVIGKYHKKFDSEGVARACERIGRNPNHPKYLKYKGKSKAQILAEWKLTSDIALDNGNEKHNYLEDAIKTANGYNRVANTMFITDKIHTIDHLLDPNFIVGTIDEKWLIRMGVKVRYPAIYEGLMVLINAGYRIFSEVGVYNAELLVSGLIDVLAVKDNEFIIVDWKTNRANIRYESGYYAKDIEGNLTDEFIYTNKYMLSPIHFLQDSTGVHYNLQISGYAWLVEQFGLKNIGNVIYQIREDESGGLERIDKIKLLDYRDHAELMFRHHSDNTIRNSQTKMFV